MQCGKCKCTFRLLVIYIGRARIGTCCYQDTNDVQRSAVIIILVTHAVFVSRIHDRYR